MDGLDELVGVDELVALVRLDGLDGLEARCARLPSCAETIVLFLNNRALFLNKSKSKIVFCSKGGGECDMDYCIVPYLWYSIGDISGIGTMIIVQGLYSISGTVMQVVLMVLLM